MAKSLYDYDTLDRRTRQERADGSYWNYLYDTKSQLTSAKRKWQDGSFVAGQQYEFEWDSIGNRARTAQGGDPSGGGLRDAIYVSNALNQYRQRGVPGKVDLIGTAETGTTVSVDSEPTLRQGKYFWKEVTLNNATNPVWATAQVRAVLKGAGSGGTDIISTESRELSVAKTPEIFTHDLDGNLIQDGKWAYNWDAESRLVAIESISSVPAANKKKFEFAYDGDGRRVRSKAYIWNSGTSQYQLSTETKFIYDGWLCLAETNGSLGLVRSYCWGSDLSGTFEGAGGVGGLLWMKDAATSTVYDVSYDGNGNVIKLTKASDGSVAASYEYSPFGEVIESSGSYAASNPFRFSTKYQDGSRLIYYGYRYMNPDTGRWLSRDPIAEKGGTNLYAFVGNNGINRFDRLGLCWSNARAYLHYTVGAGRPVSLKEIGCFGAVSNSASVRSWINGFEKQLESDLRELIDSAKVSGKLETKTYRLENSGGHSGVWWIGGIQHFKQMAECVASCTKAICNISYYFSDPFEEPFDFKNKPEDREDLIESQNPGTDYSVLQNWEREEEFVFEP